MRRPLRHNQSTKATMDVDPNNLEQQEGNNRTNDASPAFPVGLPDSRGRGRERPAVGGSRSTFDDKNPRLPIGSLYKRVLHRGQNGVEGKAKPRPRRFHPQVLPAVRNGRNLRYPLPNKPSKSAEDPNEITLNPKLSLSNDPKLEAPHKRRVTPCTPGSNHEAEDSCATKTAGKMVLSSDIRMNGQDMFGGDNNKEIPTQTSDSIPTSPSRYSRNNEQSGGHSHIFHRRSLGLYPTHGAIFKALYSLDVYFSSGVPFIGLHANWCRNQRLMWVERRFLKMKLDEYDIDGVYREMLYILRNSKDVDLICLKDTWGIHSEEVISQRREEKRRRGFLEKQLEFERNKVKARWEEIEWGNIKGRPAWERQMKESIVDNLDNMRLYGKVESNPADENLGYVADESEEPENSDINLSPQHDKKVLVFPETSITKISSPTPTDRKVLAPTTQAAHGADDSDNDSTFSEDYRDPGFDLHNPKPVSTFVVYERCPRAQDKRELQLPPSRDFARNKPQRKWKHNKGKEKLKQLRSPFLAENIADNRPHNPDTPINAANDDAQINGRIQASTETIQTKVPLNKYGVDLLARLNFKPIPVIKKTKELSPLGEGLMKSGDNNNMKSPIPVDGRIKELNRLSEEGYPGHSESDVELESFAVDAVDGIGNVLNANSCNGNDNRHENSESLNPHNKENARVKSDSTSKVYGSSGNTSRKSRHESMAVVSKSHNHRSSHYFKEKNQDRKKQGINEVPLTSQLPLEQSPDLKANLRAQLLSTIQGVDENMLSDLLEQYTIEENHESPLEYQLIDANQDVENTQPSDLIANKTVEENVSRKGKFLSTSDQSGQNQTLYAQNSPAFDKKPAQRNQATYFRGARARGRFIHRGMIRSTMKNASSSAGKGGVRLG